MTESEFISEMQEQVETLAAEHDGAKRHLRPAAWFLSDYNRELLAVNPLSGIDAQTFVDGILPRVAADHHALAVAFVAHRDICTLERVLLHGASSEQEIEHEIECHGHYEVIELAVIAFDAVKAYQWRVLRDCEDSKNFVIEDCEQVPADLASRFEEVRIALTANMAALN